MSLSPLPAVPLHAPTEWEDDRGAAEDWGADGWDETAIREPAAAKGGRPSLADQLRARLLTPAQLEQMTPPSYLVDRVLVANTLAVLYGRPGTYKSFVALDIALSVAVGAWWFDHEVAQGDVLYLAAEGQSGLHQRVDAWQQGRNIAKVSGITWLPGTVNLLDKGWRTALVEVVEEQQPVLVVLDTLARSMVGADENSARDVGLAIDAADALRQVSQATVLLVHHSGKDGLSLRGSSALEGASDTIIECRADGDAVTLKCQKAKDSAPFPSISLRSRVIGDSCLLESHGAVGLTEEMVDSERHLLAILWDSFGTTGTGTTDLRDVSEMPKSTFYRALNALLARGVVLNSGSAARPLYRAVQQEVEK